MNGLEIMIKAFGLDPEQIQKQAHEAGQALDNLNKTLENIIQTLDIIGSNQTYLITKIEFLEAFLRQPLPKDENHD